MPKVKFIFIDSSRSLFYGDPALIKQYYWYQIWTSRQEIELKQKEPKDCFPSDEQYKGQKMKA